MKPLVGVDESTLVQSERPEQETNIYDLLYHQFGCFAKELMKTHVGTTSFPFSLFAVPGESGKRHAGNEVVGRKVSKLSPNDN